MADEALAQSSTAGISCSEDTGQQDKVRHSSPPFRKVGADRALGLLLDVAAILSRGMGHKSLCMLMEACRVHATVLSRKKGVLRIRGIKIHYLDFGSFLYAYREIFVRRVYLMRAIPSSPRILDCGANIGLAALFFKLQWPESTVLCFEPDPETFAALCRNLGDNGLAGVKPINAALWDTEGEIEFYVPPDARGSLCGSAIPSRSNGRSIPVPARRLSSFIGERRVDLLKLDIEGAEQRVLQDLSASGKLSLVDAIIAEYHHRIGGEHSQLAEFLALLERSGFEYQLHAAWRPAITNTASQDVLIYAERSCTQ